MRIIRGSGEHAWNAASAGTRGADDPPCCPDPSERRPLLKRRYMIDGTVRERLPATRMFLIQGRRA